MSEARIQLDAQVQVRRDIEANWAAVDPVLRDGEIAYSKDINRIKVGDGARKWSELEYMAGSSASISLDTEMSDTSENAVPNKVIKAYVDGKAKEAQAAAEQYIQDEVLTDYATTKYVGEREEYLVGYAEGLVNDLEKDINGRGYLTSAAMDLYAKKEDIKGFVTKGSTLEHYGITDAVISRIGFEPYESGVGNRMGYSYSSKGWKVDGPAMVWGLPTLNARLNADIGSGDNPGLYLSIYNGTAYQWAQIVTDKNFTQFGVKAGRRYTGAYDDDPKSANDINYPSMSGFTSHLADVPFQNGNLLAITTNPNLYVGQIAISADGRIAFRSRTETAWADWQTILHTGNIGTTSLPSLNLNGKTITSWDDIKASGGGNCITSDGGTINAGKYLKFATSAYPVSLGVASTLDDYDKLVVSGLTQMSDLYITEKLYFENGCTVTFRNWSTGEKETISSFSDLKTILGLKSLAYKDEDDFVKVGFRFDSIQTGAVNILGWVEAANNWKGKGAGIVVGQKDYYSRINIVGANNEPTMYISNIWGGIAYDWVKVLTEKNIGSHAIEIVNASTYPLPTDTRAFATYAYQRDGWKTAGPALAFAGGNYKGLIQMGVSDYAADPNSVMRMYIGGVRPDSEGGLQPWVEVLTDKNIGSFAMSLGQVTIGSDIDLNELLVPGAYNISGGPTNKPIGVGDGSLLVVGDKNKYFMSQYMVGYNNNLYYRLKEGKSWKDWRIVVTDGNIGDYAISKAGGSINGNITLNSLYVKGSIYFGSKLAFAGGTNWFSFGEQYMNDGDAVYINGRSLYFRASATTDLAILSSGNIGIGTTSPSSKLHVNGLITAGGGIKLGGETITSWDSLKSGWWDQRLVTLPDAPIAIDHLSYINIARDLNSNDNITIEIRNSYSFYMATLIFATGSTIPNFTLIETGRSLIWENGINVFNNLEPNTIYKIDIDYVYAAVTTYNR